MRASPRKRTNRRPNCEKQTYFTDMENQAMESRHLGGDCRDKRDSPGSGRDKRGPP